MDKNELLKKYITSEYLGFSVSNELFSTIITLGTQVQLFRKICLNLLEKRDKIEHKPVIGANITFSIDYVNNEIEIDRLQRKDVISLSDFCKVLALIDSIYTPIYPLGSVVELDESLLPSEIKQLFENSELGFLVTLHARKVAIEKTNLIIDYVGTIWPLGMLPEVEPIIINNLMIKRIVSSGLSNEYEEKYVSFLRRKQLLQQQQSYIFSNLELTLKAVKSDEN
ncbi:MAG: DUF4176 domain-containing protein [Lactobacillus sp.]|nr:DUF4176 domain-containing protein [Lactobacillus sp.]